MIYDGGKLAGVWRPPSELAREPISGNNGVLTDSLACGGRNKANVTLLPGGPELAPRARRVLKKYVCVCRADISRADTHTHLFLTRARNLPSPSPQSAFNALSLSLSLSRCVSIKQALLHFYSIFRGLLFFVFPRR